MTTVSESSGVRRQIIDTTESAARELDKFLEDVAMLAGLVVEGVEENPVFLLSPVLRQIIVEKAKNVEARRAHLTAHGRICIDCLSDLKSEEPSQ